MTRQTREIEPCQQRIGIKFTLPGSDRGVVTVPSLMTRAIFDGVVLAESDDVKVVEGMTYFPLESLTEGVLSDSPTTSRCVWKGKARYWHVQGRSEIATDAAFAYEKPWPLARRLVSGRIAFWQGVEVVDD